jgi:hypothetical protein
MSTDPDLHRHDTPRLPYALVAGVLFTFWAAVAICVAMVFSISAWRDRQADDAAAIAPTATAVSAPAATPVPRPPAVPLSARLIEGTFESGEPEPHLFFHIGCADGVLAVITTEEQLYAESPCQTPIPRARIEPFLGMPVRVTVGDRRLDLSSAAGDALQFLIGRVWVVER